MSHSKHQMYNTVYFLNIRYTGGGRNNANAVSPPRYGYLKETNVQAVQFYRDEIDDNLVYHYDNCLNLNGGYIEK